jgi:hypothetical protein
MEELLLVKTKREYTISELEKWIKSLPRDRLEEVAVIAGDKYFTPTELMKAVYDKKNPYGKMLVGMFNNYRIEMAKVAKIKKKEGELK